MKRKVPDRLQLEMYAAQGLGHAAMARQWEIDSGIRVTRQAMAMACAREGVKIQSPRPTYRDLLPWRVRPEHRMHWDARMLRLEGRRRSGEPLKLRDLVSLNNWRKRLRADGVVIAYDEATGFTREPKSAEDRDLSRP